jgi:hypothetical protein
MFEIFNQALKGQTKEMIMKYMGMNGNYEQCEHEASYIVKDYVKIIED